MKLLNKKLEDLNLPNATVLKIIKDAIPDNVIVGKDARCALSKAASVFVLYLTSQATKQAQKNERKTLTGQDIIAALEELEFEEFVDPLQNFLKDFKASKQKKAEKKKAAVVELVEEEEDDVEMPEDEAVEDEEHE